MKKKRVRAASALLCAAVTVTSVPLSSYGFERVLRVASESETQMSSEPELVYANSYGGGEERSQNFDDNWKFNLGDVSGGEDPSFNDSDWRSLSLPHDYSIEQEFSQSMEAESGYLPGGIGWYRKNFIIPADQAGKQVRIDFDGVYMDATVYINGHELGTHPYGYTPFSYDLTDYIKFGEENVIAVKVNHQTPSSRWYSGSGIYRSVDLTITEPVHVGLEGTAVTTPELGEGNTSRVKTVLDTTVDNDSEEEQKVKLLYTLYKKGDPEKTAVAAAETEEQTVAPGGQAEFHAETTVSDPDLWGVYDSQLYVVETQVQVDGRVTDTYRTDFGFRYMEFDSDSGFSLNGEHMKLKGVCMHHDQGALGAVDSKAAIRRQVEILKDMGCNAIRVTHNPASRNLIEVCNEMGILVIEEAFDGWLDPKNGNSRDYSRFFKQEIGGENEIIGREDGMTWAEFDLKAMIRRDRNAPSVIAWSLGNEITEGTSGSEANYVNQTPILIEWAKEADATRPLTIGDNRVKNGNGNFAAIQNDLTESGGLVGVNYTDWQTMKNLHEQHPDWKIYGSETASAINSRGIYKKSGYASSQNSSKQLTSYDISAVSWGATAAEAWRRTIKSDFVAGEFVWTGFDYIGEPTPWNGTGPGAQGAWPSPKSSYFGIVDTAGFPKDSYYLYQSLWNDEVNTLHILPAWNEDVVEKDGQGNVEVVVYSDAPTVELFFTPADGGETESLGSKTFQTAESEGGLYEYQYCGDNPDSASSLYRTWSVPYEAGTITAKAYTDESKQTEITDTEGRNQVSTTGEEAKLTARVYGDRDTITADGKDLAYIEVDVTDADGQTVPDADDRVTFKVEGDGVLVGVDNGSAPDHDSYKADSRQAFSGKVVAIVQSTKKAGEFTVTAEADGLEGTSVTVSTEPEESESVGDKTVYSYEIARNYYVKTGNMPELPETLTVTYTDQTTAEEPVEWETITQDQIEKVGTFQVRGTLESGTPVSVNVNMISDVAALLNYSTATPVGQKPILPASRQAVLENGEVLTASFPVEWNEPDESVYSEPGTVVIDGTADVLGREVDVTASVRVQEESFTLGENVAKDAEELTQSLTEEQQSDTLEAVRDGSTAISDNSSGGANPTVWSNWKASNQLGITEADLTFRYATQLRLGQVVIYFAKDNGSMRYPDAGTTEIYVSETGGDDSWIKVEAEETIGEENGRVKAYTYDFAPVNATFVKVAVTNTKEATGTSQKACTGITEIELRRVQGSYEVNSTAQLASLSFNGYDVPAGALEGESYSTPALVMEDVEYTAKDNGAVTFIPPYEDEAHFIIEAEDHSVRKDFVIELNGENVSNLDPEDSTYDYERTATTVTAGDSQPSQQPELAIDGQIGTRWHTTWNTTTPVEERWIQLELEEETLIDGLRYYARDDQTNGRVDEYRVEVSSDGETWETAATGNWENTGGWKLAAFSPVKAKFVKLTGVHTYGDGGQQDMFMSADEIRVRMAPDVVDISSEESGVEAVLSQTEFELDEITGPVEPEVTLTKGGEELRYGIDYRLKYENNEQYGTAKVIVEGILSYGGTLELEFQIFGSTSRTVFAEGGSIVEVNGKPVEETQESRMNPGQTVTVKAAEAAEGTSFSHWRVVPSGLDVGDADQETITFTMPESSVRLYAVYGDEEGNVQTETYSKTVPSTWFAYGDEAELDSLLEEYLTDEDREEQEKGGSVHLVLELKKTEEAPAYRAETADAKATPSELATPSEFAAGKVLRPASEVRRLMKQEAGADEDHKEIKDAFYLDLGLDKALFNAEGALVKQESVATPSEITVTVEVPAEERNMQDYQVVSYENADGEDICGAVASQADGGFITFQANTSAIYGVFYTKCFDVTFVDYDGRIISKQRVAYGEAAEAPEDPEREGYVFVGWDKDFDEITKDITVKAVYEEEKDPALEQAKAALEAEIDRVYTAVSSLREEDYTAASWRALEKALEKAESVLDNEKASVSQVNKAKKDLTKALDGLEKKEDPLAADKEKLENAITRIEEEMTGMNQHIYTAASWNRLENALAKANEVLGDDDADKDELQQALADLENARSGLRRKSSDSSDSSSSGSVTISDGSTPLAAVPALDGTWEAVGENWKFRKADGTYAAGEWAYILYNGIADWYCFDENGMLRTGWYQDANGDWFFLHDLADGRKGHMYTGWQWLKGSDGKERCYYFNEVSDGTRGALKTNTTVQGYTVNGDGQWTENGTAVTR
ncbi:MAG TPA: discoidin domain-containing protein [Candidatus Lachnoclostridium pullistercoris]|uniref:Discoidin domain-containing protein n=1 Tax=Candidatus Lachnoclostridium pullistercoris TaxID=2838632 RepID=A0A9D2P9A1_9FIRM|nr:discoidin domain-containing protein [Candidatus Lachnoclostridium pullistercoris]